MYKYSVEMFVDGKWTSQIRYYHVVKDLRDFDLCDIHNKRRNAKKL